MIVKDIKNSYKLFYQYLENQVVRNANNNNVKRACTAEERKMLMARYVFARSIYIIRRIM